MIATHDNVVVLTTADCKTWVQEGKLLKPDDTKFYPLPSKGKVIAVGPGRLLKNGARTEMKLRIGDLVIIPRQMGVQWKKGGKIYIILKEKDVLARIA